MTAPERRMGDEQAHEAWIEAATQCAMAFSRDTSHHRDTPLRIGPCQHCINDALYAASHQPLEACDE